MVKWLASECKEVEEALDEARVASAKTEERGEAKEAKEHLREELGDMMFDALMTLHIAHRDLGLEPGEVMRASVANFKRRTPYMRWGEEEDGAASRVGAATTCAEAEAQWTAAKRREKPFVRRQPPAVPPMSLSPLLPGCTPPLVYPLVAAVLLQVAGLVTDWASRYSLGLLRTATATDDVQYQPLPDAV